MHGYPDVASQIHRPVRACTLRPRGARWIVPIAAFIAVTLAERAAAQGGCDYPLQGADLGAPGAAGSESCSGGVYTITGAGTGVYQGFTSSGGGDPGHLSYVSLSGDVEIVARVTGFTGGPGAEVGLMVRESASATALMGAVIVKQPPSPGSNLQFWNSDRHRSLHPIDEPNQNCSLTNTATAPPITPPYWIKLVRVGKTFATSRSSDGAHWCPVTAYSGGSFETADPFLAGIFVSGGQSGVTATATLDSLYIGAPRLEYRTSLVGNSYSNDSDRWVAFIHSLWVAPDGRSYTTTYYDEGAEGSKIYDADGRIVGALFGSCFGGGGVAEGAVTGDGANLYVAYNWSGADHVLRTDENGDQHSAEVAFRSPINRIGGLGAANGELYVADVASDQVVVASTVTMSETSRFAFTRPGPIAVDSRGDLWIIQRAADWPISEHFTPSYAGAVRCFHPDGTFTGREITDVVNPSALCIDPNVDRLLVCEYGPDQNIRIYTDLATAPAHTSSFGTVGGVFGSGVPGLLDDPANGGDQRLWGPVGVGVDDLGDLYVACGGQLRMLRKYDSSGVLQWSRSSVVFQDCLGFDPTTDGEDLYWKDGHMTLDYSGTAPGSEWSLHANGRDPAGPGALQSLGGSIVRRLGPSQDRYLYQVPNANEIPIYRFVGETVVPCGRWYAAPGHDWVYWADANGDGLETPDEDIHTTGEGFKNFDVAESGDLYGTDACWNPGCEGQTELRHYRFLGLNPQGAPLYNDAPGNLTKSYLPPEVHYVVRIRYDEAHDALYVLGVDTPQTNGFLGLWRIAVYDHWNQPDRSLRFTRRLPHPTTEPDMLNFPPYPSGEGFAYFSLDAIDGMIFATELWGPIHVFDSHLGNEVTRLFPGPEVSGVSAWDDIWGGTQGIRRSTGEYVVVREDGGYRNRCLMFRWTPLAVAPPTAPTNLAAEGGSRAIGLTWDGGLGYTQKYTVWRGTTAGAETLLADDVTAPRYDDASIQFGATYYYRVTQSNAAGTSPPSNEASAVALTYARFLREDSTTQGNWIGKYGNEGYAIPGTQPGQEVESFPMGVDFSTVGHRPPRPCDVYDGGTNTDARLILDPSGAFHIRRFWTGTLTAPFATFDLDLHSGDETQVAMYFVDTNDLYTTEMTVFDGLGRQLGTHTMSQLGDGKWALWRIAGHVRFVLHPTHPPPSDPNTTALGLQGIMLDPKPAKAKPAPPPRPLH